MDASTDRVVVLANANAQPGQSKEWSRHSDRPANHPPATMMIFYGDRYGEQLIEDDPPSDHGNWRKEMPRRHPSCEHLHRSMCMPGGRTELRVGSIIQNYWVPRQGPSMLVKTPLGTYVIEQLLAFAKKTNSYYIYYN